MSTPNFGVVPAPRDDVTTLPIWDIPSLGVLGFWVIQWDPCRGSGVAVEQREAPAGGLEALSDKGFGCTGAAAVAQLPTVVQITISDQSLPAFSSHVLCTHLWSMFIVCFFHLTAEGVNAASQFLWDSVGRYISDSPFKSRQMPVNQF